MVLAAEVDFWRWVPHPEVWVLLGGLTGLYVYAARVIGPKAVPAGERPVSAAQWCWFAVGMVLLWAAADWPMHDIGEQYLYSVHMVQHTLLTLVIPPALLLATPQWLARLVLGRGRVDRVVHQLARPIPAALIFNGLALITHWHAVVNLSSQNGLFHYGVHAAIVTAAFLFWIPVCGPLPELRIALPTQMLYLFVTSIIPTVPGAWLTLADGAVYRVYDIPQRMFDISVTSDQQAAGLFMKLGAGMWLWLLITIIFFTWAHRHAMADRYGVPAPTERQVLTWEQVRAEFDRHPAPPEDRPTEADRQ
jgi:putative membrane protein